MPAKEILSALQEMGFGRVAGPARQWPGACSRAGLLPRRRGRVPAAYRQGTPKVPEHEAEKIRRKMRKCPHGV